MKVTATEEALQLIKEIKENHGPDLLFHQSGGCCDGSSPMCFPKKSFELETMTSCWERSEGSLFTGGDQFEKWKNTDLIIDAVKGIGGCFLWIMGPGRGF